jgi:hypothetical protein
MGCGEFKFDCLDYILIKISKFSTQKTIFFFKNSTKQKKPKVLCQSSPGTTVLTYAQGSEVRTHGPC